MNLKYTIHPIEGDDVIGYSVQTAGQKLSMWVANTGDEVIKKQLMALGWTPPAQEPKNGLTATEILEMREKAMAEANRHIRESFGRLTSFDPDEERQKNTGMRAMLDAMRIAERPPGGLPYGIIDPDYARIFTIARTMAWQEGYAIAMQGSFTRDLDLVALPWTESACDPEKLVARIADAAGLKPNGHPPGEKPHGRLAWTLLLPGFSDPRFVDLSIIPRLPKIQPAAAG